MARTRPTTPVSTGTAKPNPAPVSPPITASVRLVGRPTLVKTATTTTATTNPVTTAVRPASPGGTMDRINVLATAVPASNGSATVAPASTARLIGTFRIGTRSPGAMSAPPSLAPVTTANATATAVTTSAVTEADLPPRRQ